MNDDEINTRMAMLQDVDEKAIKEIAEVQKLAIGRCNDLLALVQELRAQNKKLGAIVKVQALAQKATNTVLEDLRKRVAALEAKTSLPFGLHS